MTRFKDILSKRWGAYSIAAVIGVVTYLLLANISGVLSWLSSVLNLMAPIIIGLIIAYIVNLIVVFFERKVFRKIKNNKFRSVLSVVISIIIVLVIIGLVMWLVLPEVFTSASDFITNARNYSSYLEQTLAKLDEFAARYGIELQATTWTMSMYSTVDEFITGATHDLANAMSTLMSVTAVAINIFIGAILAVYFLAGKRKLFEGLTRFRKALLTEEQYKKHTDFLRRSSNIFSKYISYTILEAVGVGITNAIFMLIAGLPNVVLVSVVVGITNILPTFGPIVGCVIGALVLLVEDPFHAVIFVIFTLILQTIDGYIIKPKLFGNTLGIPSFLSLIAIILGGKLFGPVGILISIPFAAVLSIIYHESFLPWLEKKKQDYNSSIPKQKK
ncbi:Predicted PurR-regulated permease PerM [Ruminococcaceae bacterium YRB3002]|nr:Predicted PurR-regulated permease PerM [Ruminococcaceae bacterium YRB3002]